MMRVLNFLDCLKGSVTTFAAITIPVLVVVAGSAIDYSLFLSQRTSLQSEIDGAVLNAARIFIDQPTKTEPELTALVQDRVLKVLAASKSGLDKNVKVTVDTKERLVRATASFSVSTSFLTLAGIESFDATVQSAALAEIERQPVCILALRSDNGTGIKFSGSGEMKAKDCVVWSNATGVQSIDFGGNGKVSASRICARGRAGAFDSSSVKPQPESGCAFVEDPMKNWREPDIASGCEQENSGWISRTTAQLGPCVYRGGLRVDAKNIFLSPGIYVIKDGPLVLRGSSKIVGKDVGIFLTGTDTKLDIDGKSSVNLVAAREGPMAGIAIAADRNATPEQSSIAGRSDLKIGGVVYLPTHDLTYWGESDTRAASPVTTIIGNAIEIGGDAYLEVKNDRSKAKYAPIVTTGEGTVKLVE